MLSIFFTSVDLLSLLGKANIAYENHFLKVESAGLRFLGSYVIFYGLFETGAWLSLVEHLLWEQRVAGSNPVAPTRLTMRE
jgi:hypothetical protein